jgi:predicted phosphodiesterase
MFEYSPYVIDFDEENSDLNNKNISKILSKKNTDDTITIAITGDTHRDFDEIEVFAGVVNNLLESEKIDFVIHTGDISDFGLPKQYLWANSNLQKLTIPYIVILGNHDIVGNGEEAYITMFGNENFSFIYDNIKFIAINTNSREYSFNGKIPDVNWLDSQLKPAADFNKAVVMFHVPPMDLDFDNTLEHDFSSTLSKYNNVLIAIHGHTHRFEIYTPYKDGVLYLNIDTIAHENFCLIKISNDTVKIETHEL